MNRTAVLYDEYGVEVYRGSPGALPFLFSSGDDEIICDMSALLNDCTPFDEHGNDLKLSDCDRS